MKPATTLKDLLKPPFEADRSQFGYIYVVDNEIIDAGNADSYINSILSKKRRLLQPVIYLDRVNHGGEVADFAAAAMNEKWERDFGEQLRWLLDNNYDYESVNCPYCGIEYRFETLPDWENYSYCPHCGKRARPPEGHDE